MTKFESRFLIVSYLQTYDSRRVAVGSRGATRHEQEAKDVKRLEWGSKTCSAAVNQTMTLFRGF